MEHKRNEGYVIVSRGSAAKKNCKFGHFFICNEKGGFLRLLTKIIDITSERGKHLLYC